MSARVVAAALLLSACVTTTRYTDTGDAIVIRGGLGGGMNANQEQYDEWEGKRLIIDGQVISADAFFAFSHPNACYTENAVFSPHAVSWMGLFPLYGQTEQATDMLPAPLAEWFRNDFSSRDWIGFARLDSERLRQIWPEGECTN